MRAAALIAALAAASALAQPAASQTPVRQPDVRSSNQAINPAIAGSGVAVPLNNAEGCLGLTIIGLTASNATLQPQTSNDNGGHWSAGAVRSDLSPYAALAAISADGQYRMDVAGHTNAQIIVLVPGVGAIAVTWTASSVPCSASSPALPGTWASPLSAAYEGHHQFAVGPGGLSQLNVVVSAQSGWVMLFDAIAAPADGAVTACAAPPAGLVPPCLKRCYYVKSDGVAGDLGLMWPAGQYLAFSAGLAAAFSINAAGCTIKTESATAHFQGDVQ